MSTRTTPPFPKIQSPWKRDEKGRFIDEVSRPWLDAFSRFPFYATEKVDGANTRISVAYGIQGRTDAAQWNSKVLDDITEAAVRFERAVGNGDVVVGSVLYGETVGPKIQGNPCGFKPDQSHEFILFDVWHPSFGWAERDVVQEIAETVDVRTPEPIGRDLDSGFSLQRHLESFQAAVRYGYDPTSPLFPEAEVEGIVLRPHFELRTARGERIITKVKVKDFKEGR